MTRIPTTLICCAAIALACAPAAALAPAEVAVIANSQSAESLDIAKEYMAARGIPEGNLIKVDVWPGYSVTRAAYEKSIRGTIRAALTERGLADKVRCLCLIHMVPVRVLGYDKKQLAEVKQALTDQAREAQQRLAVIRELASRVGEGAAPKTDALTPLEAVFGDLPAPPGELPELPALQQAVMRELTAKQNEVDKIADADRRRIANQRMMALVLEGYGAEGLIKYLARRSPEGAPDVEDLKRRLAAAREALPAVRGSADPGAEVEQLAAAQVKIAAGVSAVATQAVWRLAQLGGASGASVDSELALLWWDVYEPAGMLSNGLHWRSAGKAREGGPRTLMTARIDGPTPEIARRIIADSVAVEQTGLEGVLYIDAGGPHAAYDANFRALEAFVREHVPEDKLKVVIEPTQRLFQPGDCPDAALYVGWYSLRKYIPAFTWKRGAVGWHVASFEAQGLRNPDSATWCTKMLQNGASATLGAVDEPYLHAFPLPQEFFPLLLTGKFTMAECYWRTVPLLSWQMTLICDPLYSPFANRPLVKVEDLPEGLAP